MVRESIHIIFDVYDEDTMFFELEMSLNGSLERRSDWEE